MNDRGSIRSLLLMGLFGFTFALPGFGCQCVVPADAPSVAMQRATAVFIGTVTDLAVQGEVVTVRLRLTQIFKGVSKDASDLEIQTADGTPACGFSFSKGQSYIVYADRPNAGSVLRVSKCSRTRRLDEASEDLKFLNSPK